MQATILIINIVFSDASSTADGFISGTTGYTYISLDKHPFLSRNRHLEAIRDCINDLTEGYNQE